MTTLGSYYEFRKTLTGVLMRDVVGPGEADEVIADPPITKYLAGILYPQSADAIDPTQDFDLSDQGEAEPAAPDPPVAMANVRYPSSMGMTFAVEPSAATEIVIAVEAALYEELQPGDAEGSEEADEKSDAATAEPDEKDGESDVQDEFGAWKRHPVSVNPVHLDISTPVSSRVDLGEGLELFFRVRGRDKDGTVPVTLVLLNTRKVSRGLRDSDAFFQPRISVRAVDGSDVFAERSGVAPPENDQDLRSYRLLYRHARAFATGHGCSVEWAKMTKETGRTRSIETTFSPSYNLWLADSNPAIESPVLRMRTAAEAPRQEVVRGLEELCAGYEAWITERRAEAEDLPPDLQDTARVHLDDCETAVRRMRLGAAVLVEDSEAWEAFRLANQAMLMQRARSEWLSAGAEGTGPDVSGDHRWYPFQLAFILLCIAGISEPGHEDRTVADLLWFPTGGGKTEAYLGLIAFTVFLRRLRQEPGGGGVTALMRYTLRLLTIQQFERAALLICCCEHIRLERGGLGDSEISIGLWIGQDGSPNDRRAARIALDTLQNGGRLEKGSPVQLHACPWCGKHLDHRNYWLADHNPRLVISCRRESCDFKAGLPIYVVDEDLYQQRPSLVIATADKFASLPFQEQVGALFNLGTGDPPPELIIQDELHLISGPLGTLAGLYETAVDLLCTDNGHKPKVIASTATIRRAAPQTAALFDRSMLQFPPPGLDARDSYFAVEASPEEKGTRLYLGLMAPGVSQATLMIRAYAALLQAAEQTDADPQVKDAYWTLVGYFNSLRILGGARMQVQDDVTDRIGQVAADGDERSIENRIELTSRETSADIPARLREMAVSYPDEDALDVILATNMISVGVDVERLGLMVVMGQPQSTAEYIQATSRVGRRYPGLVIPLFNAARSRDRSHYESFNAYHGALYRQVESTSVTPFSARARDRALPAVLVALVRLLVPRFRANDAASQILGHESELNAVRAEILRRVEAVEGDELDQVEAELEEIVQSWIRRAEEQPELVYVNWRQLDRGILVPAADADRADPDQFPTMSSLRDVDQESNLFLVR